MRVHKLADSVFSGHGLFFAPVVVLMAFEAAGFSGDLLTRRVAFLAYVNAWQQDV